MSVSLSSTNLLIPDWGGHTPPGVHALVTTRNSLRGVSPPPFDRFNLGTHVDDDPTAVSANRAQLRALLPGEPLWLNQVHGVTVVAAKQAVSGVTADASFSRNPDVICAIMSADCLPVLFAARDGSAVAAAHAGWRGLAGGIVEATFKSLNLPAEQTLVWLGPAIGPSAFEVGHDVRESFMHHDIQAAHAFQPQDNDKWLCDIYLLARQRLHACGIPDPQISGGNLCTHTDAQHFYSWRRDGKTGRMASLIWRSGSNAEGSPAQTT